MPHFFNVDQKQMGNESSSNDWTILKRIQIILCADSLPWMKCGSNTTRLKQTGDEEWTRSRWLGTRKRSSASAGQLRTSVFGDVNGIPLNDYLKKCKTITGKYYALPLDQVNENFLEPALYCNKKK